MEQENFSQQVIDNALNYEPEINTVGTEAPFLLTAAESMPTATAVIGHNARRTSSTMMKGGYADRKRGFFGRDIATPEGWDTRRLERTRQVYANRRPGFGNLNRWRNQSTIIEAAKGKVPDGRYRPFGSADTVSSMAKKKYGDTPAMTGGMLGQVTASSRIGMMSEARFQRFAARDVGLRSYLGGMGLGDDALNAAMANRGAAQRAILMQGGKGAINQMVGGYLSTMTQGGNLAGAIPSPLSTYASKGRNVALRQAQTVGRSGQALTARSIASGTGRTVSTALKAGQLGVAGRGALAGSALMGGRLALMASPLAPLMTAWMVYDLAKLSTQLVGQGAKLASEGYSSMMGGMKTPMMGQIYRESEAGATSRARGVSAIQNSRLNARSVLGSESGVMAGHFG